MNLSRTNTPEARRELGLDAPRNRWARAYHAGRLITAYWRSSEWKTAWTLLILTLVFSFTGIGVTVSTLDWNRRFFDVVQLHDAAAVPALLIEFTGLLILGAALPLINQFLTFYLGMCWRLWMTRSYMDRWLANNRFHDIERLRVIDNPDQRITEDTRMIAEQLFGLVMVTINSIAQAVAFSYVLYGLSVPIRLALFGADIAIPGDMLVYAVLTAGIGVWLITIIGRPLVRRTMRQQHLDADLRFGLGNIRRHAEQIALLRATPSEHRAMSATLDGIRGNYVGYIFASLGVQAAQSVHGRLIYFLPMVLALPRYMANQLTLGQYTQITQTFPQFASALSILVQLYGSVATQIAAVNRLKALDDELENPRPRRIAIDRCDEGGIRADDLEIQLPDGSALLSVPAWQVRAGERWAITGTSGCGKSTLLRTLAGLWPDGHGRVGLPADGLTMFVPQKLYLPVGQLKDAVCFPTPASEVDDARVLALLGLCRLEHLADRIHIADVWQDRLSPGEQQRMALVRVLIHRPDHLLIDEATSALDEDNAAHFYRTLIAELPDATIVSVTHAPALEQFHDHALRIGNGTAMPCRLTGTTEQ